MIIAFSSDFLEKIIFFIENRKFENFTDADLLYEHDNSTNKTCRFFEARYNSDINTKTYHFYRLIALKLIFVIVYQARVV